MKRRTRCSAGVVAAQRRHSRAIDRIPRSAGGRRSGRTSCPRPAASSGSSPPTCASTTGRGLM